MMKKYPHSLLLNPPVDLEASKNEKSLSIFVWPELGPEKASLL